VEWSLWCGSISHIFVRCVSCFDVLIIFYESVYGGRVETAVDNSDLEEFGDENAHSNIVPFKAFCRSEIIIFVEG
jgi:hypothetical protein